MNTTAQNWKVIQNIAYQPLRATPDMVLNQYYAAGACESVTAAKYPWGWETPEFDDGTGWPPALGAPANRRIFALAMAKATVT